MRRVLTVVCLLAFAMKALPAEKLTQEQRLELIRGLSAEWATCKVALPKSKDALVIDRGGNYDKSQWTAAGRANGAAARLGDLVQITKITIDDDQIKVDINGGVKPKRNWRDHVQVGVGGIGTPPPPSANQSPLGVTMIVKFPKSEPPQDSKEVKKLLSQVLDFEKHTATEAYIDKLPPEQKKAIEEKRVIEGMDRDAVIMAVGKPGKKYRETKDGNDIEEWIYGAPPGKVTFITLQENKVVKIRELYGHLGGSTVPTPPSP